MRFSFTRKINLANIDRTLWPYETEDIGVTEADSFEEAQQQVDKNVNERIGYYKGLSAAKKIEKASPSTTGTPPNPPAPAPVPVADPPGAGTPAVPASIGGDSSGPPAEFQV